MDLKDFFYQLGGGITPLNETYDLESSPNFMHKTPAIVTSSPLDLTEHDLVPSPIRRFDLFSESQTSFVPHILQKSQFFSPVNQVSDCSQLIASLENHFERPSKDRSDILSAPMSLHRGRHITKPPGTSPSRTDILHALRSNQYEANENLLDELVCKPANPYSNLMRTKNHDEIKPVLHTEPKKLRIPEQTTHAHLASPSVHIPRKPMNTPVVLQSKPRLPQSARLFPEPFQVASTPYYTGPPSSFMRNTHNSLIRTAKYGGFRPDASPAFASPVPVVTLSRVLSPRAEDENQTESARHPISVPHVTFTQSVKRDVSKLGVCTEPRKPLGPKNPFPSCFSSPSVVGFQNPTATPLSNLRPVSEGDHSTKSFSRPHHVAFAASTLNSHSTMRNTHNSLIRTAKYGGFRPDASPAFASPVPVVALSRVLSPRAEDENQTESARHPSKRRRSARSKKVSFRL